MTAPERRPPSKAFLTPVEPLNPLALVHSLFLSPSLFHHRGWFSRILPRRLLPSKLGFTVYKPPSSSSTRSRPLDSSSPLRNCYPCLRLMLRYFFLLLLAALRCPATTSTPVKRRTPYVLLCCSFFQATLREKLTNLAAARLSLSPCTCPPPRNEAWNNV